MKDFDKPLLEVDTTSDEDLISALVELQDQGLSFGDTLKALRARFGNTYDATRAASILRDL